MNIDHLFTDAGMRAFTDSQRNQHMNDAQQYGQLAEIIRRRLEQTEIDGDKPLSARFRAWRVAREIRSMEKHSRKAAASSEALYVSYVNQVLELPGRRELAAARKEDKKARKQGQTAALAAKSLDKTLAHFTGNVTNGAFGQAGQGGDYLDAEAHPYPMAAGAETQRGPRSVNDFFPRQEGRR
ncbi:hypothetical protein P3T36_006344 [Kitasatospora sp. MAP12-15]|uniref:hypothetical protein n=1 Tax=unclassified Kitasatospora TaxID=2633591 RepID=UPI002476C542|nr:hypothetical protein [Kitasatospora sp. MAP12-44]MDH6107885.1 hypothetical protein [Kitasatospora sp. MAP12-44]